MARALTPKDVIALTSFPSSVGPSFDISIDSETLVFCASDGLEHARGVGLVFLGGADRGRLYMSHPFGAPAQEVETGADMGLASPCLSPSGDQVAVLATDAQSFCPAVVDLRTGAFRLLSTRNIALWASALRFAWLDNQRLACALRPEGKRTQQQEVETRTIDASIASWTRAKSGKVETAHAFDSAEPLPKSEAHELAVFDTHSGDLTLFDPGGDLPEELRKFQGAEFPPWPAPQVSPDAPVPQGSTIEWQRAARSDRAFLTRNTTGTEVHWQRGDRCKLVWRTDAHLAELAPTQVEKIPITDRFGQEAWITVIEPGDGTARQDRPVLFSVYPDQRPPKDYIPVGRFNDPSPLNPHLLAGLGFTVVMPPIPLRPQDESPQDIAADLVAGVTHAATALLDCSAIPKGNWHVFGQSWGGWAVAMLLARTTLFRSGIAAAGLYDIGAQYTSIDPRWRYQPVLHDQSEMTQRIFRMAGPPWQHPEAYRAQSAIFEVDKIDAPLLMLHGDQDYCPLQDAEAMFVAMRSAGKTARLVRFDHEGHVLQIPANIERFYSELGNWVQTQSASADF